MNEKRCSICKEVKPLTEFSQHKSYTGGFNSRCKKCVNERSIPIPVIQLNEKRCSKCNELKPITEFPPHPRFKGGFNPQCNRCLSEESSKRLIVQLKEKRCSKCGEVKPVTEFPRHSGYKDGLYSLCRRCKKEGYDSEKAAAYWRRNYPVLYAQGYWRFGAGAIARLRWKANHSGIDFTLTKDTLNKWWHAQPDVCHYCNSSISDYISLRNYIISYAGKNVAVNKYKRFFRAPDNRNCPWLTIDRVDNKQGYAVENIVKACWICNSLKTDIIDGDLMCQIAPALIERLKIEIEKEKT
jgi:hypothetical protein